MDNPYAGGDTVAAIIEVLRNTSLFGVVQKKFYDIGFETAL
jgi:hypothetical protein